MVHVARQDEPATWARCPSPATTACTLIAELSGVARRDGRGRSAAPKDYVHVEFYILQSDGATDNFFRALEEVAARGVTVRVLLDHWANRGSPTTRRR